MHITLVNRWYPPHTGFGGVAMYNYYLSRALAKQGYDVTVLAARWSREIPKFELSNGVEIHRLHAHHFYRFQRFPVLGKYMRSLEQAIYSWQVADALKKIYAEKKIDIIEFAEINAEGYFFSRQKAGIPIVVRCHTPSSVLRKYYLPSEMPYDTKLTVRMEEFAIGQADLVTTPSKDMANVISEETGINNGLIQVIPNGLDIEAFSPKQIKEKVNSEVTVLHVGRLDRIKGIEILAQAIPPLVSKFPEARFIFIGEGRYWKDKLNLYFFEHQVSRYVTILDKVNNEELLNWYQKADIAVVPSLNYESFSYTVAQAMACGLPVVTSNIGGIPETIGEDAGILIETGSVEQLVNALNTLFQNPDMRHAMGIAGRSRAEKLFAADKVANQIIEAYKLVIA